MSCSSLRKQVNALPVGASAGIRYNARQNYQTCPRSMKVVQLICNHQVVVRFRAGAPVGSVSFRLTGTVLICFLVSGLHFSLPAHNPAALRVLLRLF